MASAARHDWLDTLRASLSDGSFVRLSLAHYTGAEDGLKSIHARRVVIKRAEKLGFTYRYKTKDIAKNYDVKDGVARIAQAMDHDFNSATLCTTAADLIYDRAAGGRESLRRTKPSQTDAAPLTHDHQKKRLVPAGDKAWMHALGITDDKGTVLKTAQDKYRQINRYVELLAPMITPEMSRVVDMGSGKGYLTFALYDYMRGARQTAPRITGVEARPDLVRLCNDIARDSGFDGLDFVQGSINDYDAAGADILIALHACDTATDDAIARGVAAGAGLIVVAPCCHKQIRRNMTGADTAGPLSSLLRHGIFLERQAEMVTDGLRALILEYCGYDTKVFEFISDSHTPKNVMIVGVKNPKARLHDPLIAQKIKETKAHFGITHHHLERIMQGVD